MPDQIPSYSSPASLLNAPTLVRDSIQFDCRSLFNKIGLDLPAQQNSSNQQDLLYAAKNRIKNLQTHERTIGKVLLNDQSLISSLYASKQPSTVMNVALQKIQNILLKKVLIKFIDSQDSGDFSRLESDYISQDPFFKYCVTKSLAKLSSMPDLKPLHQKAFNQNLQVGQQAPQTAKETQRKIFSLEEDNQRLLSENQRLKAIEISSAIERDEQVRNLQSIIKQRQLQINGITLKKEQLQSQDIKQLKQISELKQKIQQSTPKNQTLNLKASGLRASSNTGNMASFIYRLERQKDFLTAECKFDKGSDEEKIFSIFKIKTDEIRQQLIQKFKGAKDKFDQNVAQLQKSKKQVERLNSQIKKLNESANSRNIMTMSKNKIEEDPINKIKQNLAQCEEDLKLSKSNQASFEAQIINLRRQTQRLNESIRTLTIESTRDQSHLQEISSHLAQMQAQRANILSTQASLQNQCLFQSAIFELRSHRRNEEKSFLASVLREQLNTPRIKTRLIYKRDLLNKTSFHKYIDNKQRLLLIIETAECLIACFYSGAYVPRGEMNSDALLISPTNQKVFRKKKELARSVHYDEYYFLFGNTDIKLRISDDEGKVYSGFSTTNCIFDNRQATVNDILGKGEQKEVTYVNFEFYQVFDAQESQ